MSDDDNLHPFTRFASKTIGTFIGICLCGAIAAPILYVFSHMIKAGFPDSGEALTLYQSFLVATFACILWLLLKGRKKS